MAELFDMRLRGLRRDRAWRVGPELFLLDRVFDECLERIKLLSRPFERALLIGCPDPAWQARIREAAESVDIRDPGRRFAHASDGATIIEDGWDPSVEAYDLVLAIGTLDTVNDLPLALRLIHHAMKPNAFFIGAVSGGNTLPRLRAAMRAADAVAGLAAPHVHPRIEAAALASLLAAAAFLNPVVDVERVQVSYRSFDGLITDLRRMAATNVLRQSPPALTRVQRDAAAAAFMSHTKDGRVSETFEFLNFAAWTQERG